MSRLRATKHDGAGAIIRMLLSVNLDNLAKATSIRKARLVELAAGNEKTKPATSEELITLCSAISGGLLRYIIDGDAIVTDATNAIRVALISRDLAYLGDAAAIPTDFLERFRAGEDKLSADDLDALAVLLFDDRLKINRETGELVPVGHVAVTVIEHKRRPLPFPTQPNNDFHVNRAISLDPKGLAPVATGSKTPVMAVLKPEPPRAGYARFEAKLKAIAEGRQ